MNNRQQIIMLGTRFDTMGGVASVVNVYRKAGLFDRFSIFYIPTHCDGNAIAKSKVMLAGFIKATFLLITGRASLLHAHVASRSSFWRKTIFMTPFLLMRIPIILHLHGAEFTIFYEQECGSVRKRLVRYVFNRASRVVVLSSAWKTWVEGISTNPHVVAIYNPALLPEIATPWEGRKQGTVLFLGRLGKRKGVYDLLDAAAQVVPKHPHLRLWLGGDGELEQVKARAKELGISDHVELLGWVNGADKDRYLQTSMIYALPSYNEGLPMSVLEAMAAGLPILSTPIGGIPEAVTDGIEGFLVEPSDVPALAARLDHLLSEQGLAEKLGAASRHKVETTFSAEAILPQVEQLYRELGVA